MSAPPARLQHTPLRKPAVCRCRNPSTLLLSPGGRPNDEQSGQMRCRCNSVFTPPSDHHSCPPQQHPTGCECIPEGCECIPTGCACIPTGSNQIHGRTTPRYSEQNLHNTAPAELTALHTCGELSRTMTRPVNRLPSPVGNRADPTEVCQMFLNAT